MTLFLQYLNSIDPHIKFTIEQPNAEGGIPFLDTFPKPQGEHIVGSSLQKANSHRQILGLQLQSSCLGQKSCGKSFNG